jgi:hypothetical protein
MHGARGTGRSNLNLSEHVRLSKLSDNVPSLSGPMSSQESKSRDTGTSVTTRDTDGSEMSASGSRAHPPRPECMHGARGTGRSNLNVSEHVQPVLPILYGTLFNVECGGMSGSIP